MRSIFQSSNANFAVNFVLLINQLHNLVCILCSSSENAVDLPLKTISFLSSHVSQIVANHINRLAFFGYVVCHAMRHQHCCLLEYPSIHGFHSKCLWLYNLLLKKFTYRLETFLKLLSIIVLMLQSFSHVPSPVKIVSSAYWSMWYVGNHSLRSPWSIQFEWHCLRDIRESFCCY